MKQPNESLLEKLEFRKQHGGSTWVGMELLGLEETTFYYAGNTYLNALDYIVELQKEIEKLEKEREG